MKFMKVALLTAIAAISINSLHADVSFQEAGRAYDEAKQAYNEAKAAYDRVSAQIKTHKAEVERLQRECPISTYNPIALINDANARAKAQKCAQEKLTLGKKLVALAQEELEQAKTSITIKNLQRRMEEAKKSQGK